MRSMQLRPPQALPFSETLCREAMDHRHLGATFTLSERTLVLPLLFVSFAAWAQEIPPCALVVPSVLSANSEAKSQATYPCRSVVFEAPVYNRWASAIWGSKKLEGFPSELLVLNEVPAGTCLWKVKYTAILSGEPVGLEATGKAEVINCVALDE